MQLLLYNLGNQVSFSANLIAYIYGSSHFTYAPADRRRKLHFKIMVSPGFTICLNLQLSIFRK